MPNQVVKLCEALLRSISALDGTPCGLEGLAAAAAATAAEPRQQQVFRKFYDLKEDFKDVDITQKNTWKKLISDLKVPKKLAALCCSDDSRVSHRQHAAISILNLFLVEASQQDWYTGRTDEGRPVSNLASILAEQLRHSGFLQQLPVLLSTAADQLEAAQDEQEMLASAQLSDELRDSLPAPQLPYLARLQRHATDLLTLLVALGHLLRGLPTAVVTAVQRLVCAAIQHICRCLELLPDQTAPREFNSLSSAAAAATIILNLLKAAAQSSEDSSSTSSMDSSSSTSTPHTLAQLQLQWSVQLRTCCTLVLLALCQQHARKLLRQLKQGSVDGQERSSSIWQYACAQHSRLPQPYLQLCQALGNSSRAFLYVACSSEVPISKDNLSDMFASMADAIQASAELKYSLQQQQEQQQQQQPVQGLSPQRLPASQQQQQQQACSRATSEPPQQQEQQQEQQQANKDTAAEAATLLTLPHLAVVALLHWAANRSPSAARPENVTAALELIYYLLDWDPDMMPAWHADPENNPQGVAESSIRLQQQQQQQQQPGLTAPQPQASTCDSEESLSEGCQQDTMQWWMTGELLEQALVLTSTFVQKFWALLMSGEAAGPAASSAGGGAAAAVAATCAAGGSTSSSGGGNSSYQSTTVTTNSSSTAALLSEAYWSLLWATEDLLVQLKLHAAALHAAELQVLTGTDTQQPTSSSKAWAKHMPLLLRPVEAFARLFTHHQDTPDCIAQMIYLPLEAFVGPEGVLASYWRRPGASRDLDPQLTSTCFSLLKALEFCRHMQAADDQAAEDEAEARRDGLHVVVRMCLASLKSARATGSAKESACAGSSADGTSHRPGNDTCTPSSSSSDSSSGAVSLLPWLVLLGRCCLHLALELQQPDAARSVAVLRSACMCSIISDLVTVQGRCLAWLQGDSNAAELAAAGYDTQHVVAALQALTAPARAEDHSASDDSASDDSESADFSDAEVSTFAQQLQVLGRALNTLAISCACNNPHCSNLDGLSELELVQGRARLCAKCRVTRYCSKACQAQHWKLHKPACKALAAAQQA